MASFQTLISAAIVRRIVEIRDAAGRESPENGRIICLHARCRLADHRIGNGVENREPLAAVPL